MTNESDFNQKCAQTSWALLTGDSTQAMRASPVGFAFDTIEEVLAEAKRSAEVTHNHPEGIKGARAVATAIFLTRQKESRRKIEEFWL